ncbi:MAG: zf-HC2 domain-containing protein, partial [candidate division KSB1 bacterium]|nr:zf-HC2 domain-containing protein [candidate division KSB1 bacterium]
MITMHLSDDQIQDFLDQNLSQEDRLLVNEHLRNCQQCQNELSRYQRLYMALNQETVIELSPAWSAAVMKRIRAEVRKIVLRRFLNL